MGVFTVLEDDNRVAPQSVVSVAVVEEGVVLQDLPDLPTAFAYLFGPIYALNLKYPEDLRHTFETIKKVFLDLGKKSLCKVQIPQNQTP